MRQVSTGFIEASLSPVGYANAYITINGVTVEASDITDITIQENIGESGAFSIGSFNTSEITITALTDALPNQITGVPISAYFGYYVNGSFEYVPMGTFYAQPKDITHRNLFTTIKGYDRSITLTDTYTSSLNWNTTHTVAQVLAEIQTAMSLTLGSFGGLAPASVTVYEEPHGTYRDVIRQMAILMGTNAKLNRTGALDFIKAFPSTPVQTYGAYDYTSGSFQLTSDAPVSFGKLTINYKHTVDDQEVTTTYNYTAGSGSNTVTVETVNVRTQAQTNTLGQTILGSSGLSFYGYSVALPGQPQIDLGDTIEIEDVFGNEYDLLVLSASHTFNGALKSTLSAVVNEQSPSLNGSNVGTTLTEQVSTINDAASYAVGRAEYASTKADEASLSAQRAESSASSAQSSADEAIRQAGIATGNANEAIRQAGIATTNANEAVRQAGIATTSANEAQVQAQSATNSANSALNQLATVEEVVDVLNWITEHGTYIASTDTEVVPGKFYFTRSGSGTSADPYVYTVVTNPTGNPSTSGYYELDSVDEAISNYVSTHLALTDEGLFLIKDGSGYKLKLTDYGEYIVAPNGTVVNQMTADGNIIRATNGTVIAHLGYGEGASESGNADAPFYTFGTRYPAIAPQYDPTSTYAVGDCCTYSGKIWRCVSAISTPEAFNTGHWHNLTGNNSVAEGIDIEASGYISHAEGQLTRATGLYSHAEGHSTEARGQGSHAEGYHDNNQADVVRSILASGTGSHAEGMAHGGYTILASGQGSHAEGLALSGNNIARGDGSHTEGSGNTASGNYAHAEGGFNTASGIASHVEGTNSEASGHSSHAQNYGTIAGEDYQTAIGKFNANYQNGAFIIGNGAIGLRSNALTVDWNGIVQASGVIAYGVCDTAGATAAKVVTVSHNGFKLVTGSQVLIKFTNANSVASPTLNVNSTGAKAIRRYGTTAPSTSAASSWNAGSVILLIYDGTDWQMVGFLNTTYSSMTDAEYQAGTSTSSRLITPARLKSAILYHATPSNIGAVALADKYIRSSGGGLDWTSQADGEQKVISKSALAYWNGTYSGTSSNLTRCSQGNIIGRNQICYANSRVDRFSNGQITVTNASLGVTTGAKPVGILLTPSSANVAMRYNYDGSDATNSDIRAYNLDGSGFSGNLRYFCVVFQNTWTST